MIARRAAGQPAARRDRPWRAGLGGDRQVGTGAVRPPDRRAVAGVDRGRRHGRAARL